MDSSQDPIAYIFETRRDTFLNLAERIVNSPDVAEDLLQEAFLRVFDGVRIRNVRNLERYCAQVVHNLAIDWYRRQKRQPFDYMETDDAEVVEASDEYRLEKELQDRQLLRLAEDRLRRLPPEVRRVFELYRVEGLTQRQIAQQLDYSLGKVNGMIAQAVQALAGLDSLRRSA